MTESSSAQQPKKTSSKPPKLEDKPFQLFIKEDLIPNLSDIFLKHGAPLQSLILSQGPRPVTGDQCWMLVGTMDTGRKFWLCFSSEDISSAKTICLAEQGIPSTIESFLIDEKRITLPLILSRLFQRLNGQKWVGTN